MYVLSSEIKVSSSQISDFSSDFDVSSSQGDVGLVILAQILMSLAHRGM